MGSLDASSAAKGATYRDLLAGRLPREVAERLPRSFDIIGDIAVIRLDEDLIAYGEEIASAIMKIHKSVRAVYARGPATGLLRIHGLRHIGGEERTSTIYRENGIAFSVDIAYMYVNPRLASERLRIAQEVADGELVLDLFASYGGFALNIARVRSATVVASDINARAVEHMRRSIYMNRLRGQVYPVVTDSASPPLRSRFRVVIADNPTNIEPFIDAIEAALVERGRAYIYILADSATDAAETISRRSSSRLRVVHCAEVREYSPKLGIYRCLSVKV